jgi:hypothetical protein
VFRLPASLQCSFLQNLWAWSHRMRKVPSCPCLYWRLVSGLLCSVFPIVCLRSWSCFLFFMTKIVPTNALTSLNPACSWVWKTPVSQPFYLFPLDLKDDQMWFEQLVTGTNCVYKAEREFPLRRATRQYFRALRSLHCNHSFPQMQDVCALPQGKADSWQVKKRTQSFLFCPLIWMHSFVV